MSECVSDMDLPSKGEVVFGVRNLLVHPVTDRPLVLFSGLLLVKLIHI